MKIGETVGDVINYSALPETGGIIICTTVTIGYDAPWPKVQQLPIDAAAATQHILAELRPFVLQTALNDFNVVRELNAYTNEPKAMADTCSAMRGKLPQERIQRRH